MIRFPTGYVSGISRRYFFRKRRRHEISFGILQFTGGYNKICFRSLKIPVLLQILRRQIISIQRPCRRLLCDGKLNVSAVSIGNNQRLLKLRHGKRLWIRIPPVSGHILIGTRHILIEA